MILTGDHYDERAYGHPWFVLLHKDTSAVESKRKE